MQRYYGHYANRTRGERRKSERAAALPATNTPASRPATADPELPLGGVTMVEPGDFSTAAVEAA